MTKLRRHLEEMYSDRLVHMILFGSQARGDATPDSDIDVLIVLQPPFYWSNVRDELSDFVADLCLEYDVFVLFVLMESLDFYQQTTPLLINVRREGITV